jgi:hypothetical protein
LAAFESVRTTKAIVAQYKLSDVDFKKRYTVTEIFDFLLISETCRIHSKGANFYVSLKLKFIHQLTANEQRKLEELVQKIQVKHNLNQEMVDFENQIVKQVQVIDPDWFLDFKAENSNLINAIGFITVIYNKNPTRYKEAFEAETIKAIKKGVAENKANGFRNIGLSLTKNDNPMLADIYKISEIIES